VEAESAELTPAFYATPEPSPGTGGAFKGRVGLLNPSSGTLVCRGKAYDLKTDLAAPKEIWFADTNAATRHGRYCLNVHYAYFLKPLKGNELTFNWPQMRVGLDLDIIHSSHVRMGVGADYTWKGPELTFTDPDGRSGAANFARIGTISGYASINTFRCSGISPSLEARYRKPVTQDSMLEEIEVAAGVTLSPSSAGISGFRAGWRRADIDLRSTDTQFTFSWSGFFAEYVLFY
jgi:hypothetical protein